MDKHTLLNLNKSLDNLSQRVVEFIDSLREEAAPHVKNIAGKISTTLENRKQKHAYKKAQHEIDSQNPAGAMRDLNQKLGQYLEENKKPSLTSRVLKGTFGMVVAPISTAAKAVGLSAVIATSVYVGNGNDPMDIPDNVENWVNKHPQIKRKIEDTKDCLEQDSVMNCALGAFSGAGSDVLELSPTFDNADNTNKQSVTPKPNDQEVSSVGTIEHE